MKTRFNPPGKRFMETPVLTPQATTVTIKLFLPAFEPVMFVTNGCQTEARGKLPRRGHDAAPWRFSVRMAQIARLPPWPRCSRAPYLPPPGFYEPGVPFAEIPPNKNLPTLPFPAVKRPNLRKLTAPQRLAAPEALALRPSFKPAPFNLEILPNFFFFPPRPRPVS